MKMKECYCALTRMMREQGVSRRKTCQSNSEGQTDMQMMLKDPLIPYSLSCLPLLSLLKAKIHA